MSQEALGALVTCSQIGSGARAEPDGTSCQHVVHPRSPTSPVPRTDQGPMQSWLSLSVCRPGDQGTVFVTHGTMKSSHWVLMAVPAPVTSFLKERRAAALGPAQLLPRH